MNVVEIWRYPVKSMSGEQLITATIGDLGIEGDRRYGVRDATTGLILTGRREPKMLFQQASIVDGELIVTTDEGDRLSGLSTISAALSDRFGYPVELVAAGDEGGTYEAPGDIETEQRWGKWQGPGNAWHDSRRTRVSILSTDALAGLSCGPIDARRFRGNLIIDGDEPPEGATVSIGDVRLNVAKQIDRCVMVGRPQPGLPSDLGALMAVVRERDNLMGAGTLVEHGGTINVDDPITLRPVGI